MTDLFQPSPLFLFIILFKTTIYIPLCALLGLLMSIFSEGRPRIAAGITTILCLIIILTTNPILFSVESLEFLFFLQNLSNLAHGWFLPFLISFLFLLRTILFRFSNTLLEILHLILLGIALLLLFLTL